MKNTIIGLFILLFITVAQAQPPVTKYCTIEDYTRRGFGWTIINGANTYRSLVKLTITKKMDVFLSHCGSTWENGYKSEIAISPGRNGDEVSYSSIDCNNNSKAELQTTLFPGEYSITSTVTVQNPGGTRATSLSLSIITSKPFASIDSKSAPVNLGELAHCEKIHKEFNTSNYKDTYQADPDFNTTSGDVWQRFYLNSPAKVVIESESIDMLTYRSVLFDHNYNPIVDPSGILPQGIYYFVSGGDEDSDGMLSTNIEAQYLIQLDDVTIAFPPISSNLNYIAKAQMTVATGNVREINLTPQNSITSLTCFDGLGRPTRIIDKQITPSGQDLIKLIEYQNIECELSVELL